MGIISQGNGVIPIPVQVSSHSHSHSHSHNWPNVCPIPVGFPWDSHSQWKSHSYGHLNDWLSYHTYQQAAPDSGRNPREGKRVCKQTGDVVSSLIAYWRYGAGTVRRIRESDVGDADTDADCGEETYQRTDTPPQPTCCINTRTQTSTLILVVKIRQNVV